LEDKSRFALEFSEDRTQQIVNMPGEGFAKLRELDAKSEYKSINIYHEVFE
jgi:hypothetical protein